MGQGMRPKPTNMVDRSSCTATDRPTTRDMKFQSEVARSDDPITCIIRPYIKLESPGGHPLIPTSNSSINWPSGCKCDQVGLPCTHDHSSDRDSSQGKIHFCSNVIGQDNIASMWLALSLILPLIEKNNASPDQPAKHRTFE